MGWFEVLAQLKRILPLLSRLAPMLETFLATRGGVRTETGTVVDRMRSDLQEQVSAAAQKQDGITVLLEEQARQTALLTANVSQVRHENDRVSARLLEIETALAAVARGLRKIAITVISLLILCIGLLIALLLRSL